MKHRWGPPVRVEVPWSDTGGNLYTCLKCGMTRHSEPGGALGYFVHVFTLPGGTVTTGKTPPCTPSASALEASNHAARRPV